MFIEINQDLRAGFKLLPSIILLAWTSIKARYKRTYLGPLWTVLTVALGSLGIALLWGFLFQMDFRTAIPHITIGFMVWMFVTGTIVEGLTSFVSQAPTLQSMKMPICFFPLMAVTTNFIVFLHSIIVIFVILLFFPPENPFTLFWFLPYSLLTLISLFFTSFILAILNARYRDIGLLINGALPILFFLSPVIFRIEHINPSLSWVVYVNPLSLYVFAMRDPFTGITLSPPVLTGFLLFAVAQYLVLALLVKFKHKQIVYWI